MNEMAVHLRYQVVGAGGLSDCDINALNHQLRRTLNNQGGYVYPIELVAQRLGANVRELAARLGRDVSRAQAPPPCTLRRAADAW